MRVIIYLSSDAVGYKEQINTLMKNEGWKINFVDTLKREDGYTNFVYVQYEVRHPFKDIIETKIQQWAKSNGGGKNYGNNFVVWDLRPFVNTTETEKKIYSDYKDVWHIVEKDKLDADEVQKFSSFFIKKN